MKKIAIIPIDNRPVTYCLPKQIGEVDREIEILLPPREILGDLRTQADIIALLKWLEELEEVEILIISLDTLAYGGLIPSRFCSDSPEKIEERLSKLENIIRTKNLKVYAMSSIMRISNNNVNEEEKPYWSMFGTRLFEYSFASHKSEVIKTKENIKRFKLAKNEIPEEILRDYLETRDRNYQTNKKYIEWVKDGILHTLVFSKDDCAQYGLNVKEAEQLQELAEGVDEILFKTGADEIPLSLLSRAVCDFKHQKIKVLPVFRYIEETDKISNYEDISVYDSVKGQLELCGCEVIDAKVSLYDVRDIDMESYGADLTIVVNNFRGKQGELVLGTESEEYNTVFRLPQTDYFVADVKNANGADNFFVEEMLKHLPSERFFGYAGWNTTGNTLGSAISCAVIKKCAQRVNRDAFNRLQAIRFLDDWSYQANVREEAKKANKPCDIAFISEKMQRFEEKIKRIFRIRNDIKYKLPWRRSFEIEVEITF